MNHTTKTRSRFTCSILLLACLFVFPVSASAQQSDGLAQQLQQMKQQMDLLAEQMKQSKLTGAQLETQEKIESQLSLLVRQFSSGQQSDQAPSESTPETSQSTAAGGEGTGGSESNSDSESNQPLDPIGQRDFVLKAWGMMPEQLSKESGTGITPQFLPGYERAIQKYYERIAR